MRRWLRRPDGSLPANPGPRQDCLLAFTAPLPVPPDRRQGARLRRGRAVPAQFHSRQRLFAQRLPDRPVFRVLLAVGPSGRRPLLTCLEGGAQSAVRGMPVLFGPGHRAPELRRHGYRPITPKRSSLPSAHRSNSCSREASPWRQMAGQHSQLLPATLLPKLRALSTQPRPVWSRDTLSCRCCCASPPAWRPCPTWAQGERLCITISAFTPPQRFVG